MNISCGNEIFDISMIESVSVKKATTDEIIEIESEKNGSLVTMKLPVNFQTILDKYCSEIGRGLPEPTIYKFDLPVYDHDEDPSRWYFKKNGNHKFSIDRITKDGTDYSIQWKCEIRYNSENGVTEKIERTCYLSEVMTVLKQLIETPKPKTKFGGFLDSIFSGHSYAEIQKDLPSVYNEYAKLKKKIDRRTETREYFLNKHNDSSILCVSVSGENTSRKYLEDCCGFDIFSKETEIRAELLNLQEHQQKLNNSNNEGEKAVEYALKWFLATGDNYVVPVKNDCESHYRYNCILLCKPDFINEPQEYDHIIVCSAGIVLIETKHWKGNVEIRPDGKWIRKTDGESSSVGVDSPKFQMRRHEVLMQKILPSVSVYSLLCFSNASTIIDGRENFKDYPIITVEQIEETLTDLCAKETYSKEDIDRMVATIDAHKVYKM